VDRQKTKALKERLVDPSSQPSVAELKTALSEKITQKVQTFIDEIQRQNENGQPHWR
jgi:hypothetical protein